MSSLVCMNCCTKVENISEKIPKKKQALLSAAVFALTGGAGHSRSSHDVRAAASRLIALYAALHVDAQDQTAVTETFEVCVCCVLSSH